MKPLKTPQTKQAPLLYKENKAYASNKIFPLLLTIKRMLKSNALWRTFVSSFVGLMEAYPEANPSFMGFPENGLELLIYDD